MALTEAAVTACLKTVVDPNTGRDFVTEKAVKKVAVSGADVTIDVTLGYPAKSQHEALRKLVQAAVAALPGAGRVTVNLTTKIVSHAVQLGDRPHLDKLVGPVKVLLDAYSAGRLNAVYLCYTKFINTMKQEPVVEQLLPLSAEQLEGGAAPSRSWDYIYEPSAPAVIDELVLRYVEALVYQATAENLASEQSARMVAMKAATDNAGNVISELKLVYNKTRQAAITKELSEIVAGAAAV